VSKVVVPFSGGIDSTVLLHYANITGTRREDIYAISFDYGQRHKKELHCARHTADKMGVNYKLIPLGFFKEINTSSLTNTNIDVAKTRDVLGDAQTVNYVPFRNQMILSICCAIAESVGADTVMHGAAQVDTQAGYWDGSIEFLEAINNLTSLNRKHRIKIEAPLIEKSKKEIIEWGVELDVDFRNTWTCYEGKEKACGDCPACSSRLQGFIDAGIRDPIEYSREIPWPTNLDTLSEGIYEGGHY
jgi:7-cyano-7-deazaguanine synthase